MVTWLAMLLAVMRRTKAWYGILPSCSDPCTSSRACARMASSTPWPKILVAKTCAGDPRRKTESAKVRLRTPTLLRNRTKRLFMPNCCYGRSVPFPLRLNRTLTPTLTLTLNLSLATILDSTAGPRFGNEVCMGLAMDGMYQLRLELGELDSHYVKH